ncbi:hypothetical protein [Rummeliibacillus sp. SL167]|uniref:hypothetical protein n=1 Tax=Rummeliibacillus sp. SL167 TaxID=2579792 RepID=UPI0011B730C2|nr:hypothetical protein [Rummeliibacillus sp. SL167]
MSDYLQIIDEIDQIDRLLLQKYRVKNFTENLDGARLEFYHPESEDFQEIHIGTANARKYASVKVFEQVYKTFI